MMGIIDWKYLSRPLTIFMATAALSVTALTGTEWLASGHKKKLDSAVQQNRAMMARTRAIIEETAMINRYRKRFAALTKQGVIDSERRLHWISQFREQAEAMKLRSARYHISRQNRNRYWSRTNPDVDVFSSVMKIRMRVLHEGDLLTMIAALRKSSGLLSVRSCALSRTQPAVFISPTASNLDVHCELEWFTLIPKRIAGKKS